MHREEAEIKVLALLQKLSLLTAATTWEGCPLSRSACPVVLPWGHRDSFLAQKQCSQGLMDMKENKGVGVASFLTSESAFSWYRWSISGGSIINEDVTVIYIYIMFSFFYLCFLTAIEIFCLKFMKMWQEYLSKSYLDLFKIFKIYLFLSWLVWLWLWGLWKIDGKLQGKI